MGQVSARAKHPTQGGACCAGWCTKPIPYIHFPFQDQPKVPLIWLTQLSQMCEAGFCYYCDLRGNGKQRLLYRPTHHGQVPKWERVSHFSLGSQERTISTLTRTAGVWVAVNLHHQSSCSAFSLTPYTCYRPQRGCPLYIAVSNKPTIQNDIGTVISISFEDWGELNGSPLGWRCSSHIKACMLEALGSILRGRKKISLVMKAHALKSLRIL